LQINAIFVIQTIENKVLNKKYYVKMKVSGFLVCFMLFYGSLALAQSLSQSDSVMYCLGVMLAEDMKKGGLEKANNTLIVKAIEDYFAGKNRVDLVDAKSAVSKYKASIQSRAGMDFLAANAKKPGVVSMPSGLQYEIITSAPAGGKKPLPTDRVKTHYIGTTIDGKEFDSSVRRGQPLEFRLDGVIKGWQEALQMMSIGDKWRIFLPYQLGYGERGTGGSIPPYATLIFEVELLGINQ
jgi:FKBP-type peptidyl-prolyl cis-trans isomerase FklB